jgi:glutathione S-transferase
MPLSLVTIFCKVMLVPGESADLELYHNNISVCSQKVRVVLAEKNLPWTSHHLSFVKGEHLTPEFKKINPRGVVPVLVHDGHSIVESSVICTYLDEVIPDPPLMPKDAVERSTMRLWCKLPDDILHTACGTVSFAIARRAWQNPPRTGSSGRPCRRPGPHVRDTPN